MNDTAVCRTALATKGMVKKIIIDRKNNFLGPSFVSSKYTFVHQEYAKSQSNYAETVRTFKVSNSKANIETTHYMHLCG